MHYEKAKLDYLEIMFCHWRIWTYAIGTNKTIITTEDEESVQRKLDIETVKEGEVEERREVLRRHSKRTLIIPISTTSIHIL